jgi:hypothetical protein
MISRYAPGQFCAVTLWNAACTACDNDPLAVELMCRLSLWIETMDRTLPFSFLDHKIKCGNSLVGGVAGHLLSLSRHGLEEPRRRRQKHTNGVHCEKESRSKALKAFVKDRLTPDMRHFLDSPTLAFRRRERLKRPLCMPKS